MKEFQSKSLIYLEDYDVNVNRYLTYAQIQKIIEAANVQNSWAFRQQNIDMLVLLYATDIGKENLEKFTHDELLASGLIDAVFKNIKNIYQIEDGLRYTESIEQAIVKIAQQVTSFLSDNEGLKKLGKSIGK